MRNGEENDMTGGNEWDEDISDEELQRRWDRGVPVSLISPLRGTRSLVFESNVALGERGTTWQYGSSPAIQPPRISRSELTTSA